MNLELPDKAKRYVVIVSGVVGIATILLVVYRIIEVFKELNQQAFGH